VVFFYGGGWESGSRTEYAFVGRALAASGYVTVVPDYRLYPQVRFPAFLEDGAAAIRWVSDNIGRYGGDPRRIVLAGHSAGAYNAAMLALDTRYLRRAGVDPAVVRALAGLSGPYDFLPLDDPTSIQVFGPQRDLAATQPVNFARPIPAFLVTGDGDTRVRPRNTISLVARLRAVGARVDERIYPGLDHPDTLLALSVLFRGKAPVLRDLTAFLEDALRPRSGP
jgi:acetyl esterase/lipase